MDASPFSQNELLKIATGFKKHLKNNFETIKDVCPVVDSNFMVRFKALYYDMHSHQTEKDSIFQTLKRELLDFANQISDLIPIFRYYLQRAFPYDSEQWQAFGYCEIQNVINDYSGLRKCLETAVMRVREKSSELRAVNCPDQKIEEINNLSKKFAEKHDEFLEYMKSKEIRRKTYKNKEDELFQLMKVVNDAASKSLYKNPESLKYLTFPSKSEIH